MGKETKIGLAIVGALLLVLVGVLVWRLRTPAESPLALPGDGKTKAAGKSEASTTKASFAVVNKPTLVPANAASSKPPKLTSDSGQWSTVSDDKRSTDSAPALSKPTLPSYMPDPPKAAEERYAGYASTQSSPAASDEPHPRHHHGDKAAGDQAFDPFQARTASKTAYPDNATKYDDTTSKRPDRSPRYADNASAPEQALQLAMPGEQPSSSASRYRGSRYERETSREVNAQPASTYRESTQSVYGPRNPLRQSSMDSMPSTSSRGYAASEPALPPVAASQPGLESLRTEGGQYEVQPNDNYWTISEKVYGTGAYFKALAEHNRKKIRQEDRLSVGDVIATPSLTQLEKTYPDLCPKASHRDVVRSRVSTVSTRGSLGGRTYTVEEGDTLFEIARRELGKASRWSEIYVLNRDLLGKDYNYLAPGTQLVLPDGDRPDTVTRRPGTGIQR